MAEYYRKTAKKCPKYEQMETEYRETYMRACQFCRHYLNDDCDLKLLVDRK